MRKLLFILFIWSSAHGQSPALLLGNSIPSESSAQRVTNGFVSAHSLSGNDYRAVKKLTAALEREGLYNKVLQLCSGKFWNGTYAYNLVNPTAYDYSFRSKMKSGTVTASENGIVIGSGDTLNTYMIYDNVSAAPNVGVFWYSKYGVSQVIVHSASPFRIEPLFNNKVYTQIGNSALGVTAPAVPPGFCYAQRKNNDTVEFYQGNIKYQEALAFGSYSPAQNDIYFVGNADSSYILKVWGYTSVLTESEVSKLNNIINDFVSDLAGTAVYTPYKGLNTQIWKAIRTSLGAYETPMDGRRAASLKGGRIIWAGGWTADSVNNRWGYTDDYGVTNTEVTPSGPWPATNDFLMIPWGDSIFKIGGDNSLISNRRIDMYTAASGVWTSFSTWSLLSSGIGPTGTKHKQWIYFSDASGDLYRLTPAAPTPVLFKHYGGDTMPTRGFMLSLPSGRLIWGSGYTSPGTTMTGKVYYSDDDGATAHLLMQDVMFETYWPAATVTKTAVLYWSGRNDIGNVKGLYSIPITSLETGTNLNWTLLDYTPIARHAQGMCTVMDADGNPTDKAFGICGNLYNDAWLFQRID